MGAWFNDVRDWQHQARLSAFSSHRMAANLGISHRQLQRHFQGLGLELHGWITEMRLQDARHLLDGRRPVKEIAFLLGFKQPSHFTREFKRRFGLTPDAFSGTRFARNPQFEEVYRELRLPAAAENGAIR